MTRKQAIATIRAEVAEHGRTTQEALRAYIENRIGFQSFTKACREGMAVYAKNHPEQAS